MYSIKIPFEEESIVYVGRSQHVEKFKILLLMTKKVIGYKVLHASSVRKINSAES